jgi:hypothetical protein
MEAAAPKEKKRALSSNTTGLRFMQRSDPSAAVDPMANLVSARPIVATEGGVAKRRIVVTDSIAMLDGDVRVGRFSAQGFNADVEKVQRAGQRAAKRAEDDALRAEVEEARKRQADIPDDEMAKRLRMFTGGGGGGGGGGHGSDDEVRARVCLCDVLAHLQRLLTKVLSYCVHSCTLALALAHTPTHTRPHTRTPPPPTHTHTRPHTHPHTHTHARTPLHATPDVLTYLARSLPTIACFICARRQDDAAASALGRTSASASPRSDRTGTLDDSTRKKKKKKTQKNE